ncbi:rare lipoprotein A [Duganella sp. 1411]|uniref:septal ring lytic transglycosylase RlpA family protein n=1 Tax=Duganella sp. 1411 TaxID=2806572 RepID=UPI001AEA555A|nr:septal ring lytic transglycosylase RlpA family protein [Duganella sp. 1411]MBP1207228.1 rare lipoprotein A [Duganella sp. 1411]
MRMNRRQLRNACAALALLVLAGCGTVPTSEDAPSRPPRASGPVIKSPSTTKPATGLPALPPANSGRGGYYQDDGPGDSPPENLADVPDADVRNDPLLPRSNRPYVVLGKTYTPITDNEPFTQVGMGTWYGKKFHGQRTSSGEIYDMYKMTAAHPTLPIPSYARVTNMVSGATVIVRINDRGPFHAKRAIDVSYTAALKLGLLGKGSHELKIERILPEEVDRMLATKEGVSGTKAPRLQSQSRSETRLSSYAGEGGKQPSTAPQPLVLTPQAVPGGVAVVSAPVVPLATASAAKPEIEALMLGDRAPAVVGGYYLQLGAYARAENAEVIRGKLVGNGFATLEVVQSGSVHRLFGGPFASRQEALQAAQGLPSSLSLKPIVVQR